MSFEIVFVISLLVIISVFSIDSVSADTGVNSLTCEYLKNPLGIDVVNPRLSWMISSDKRFEAQTAYQVLVASSEKILADDKGDLWDSGKVNSAQSVHVPYGGRELTSGMRCWWKVRVWGKDGNSSPWSEPALWTMGLLSSEDWKGKWIASESEMPRAETVNGAHWIWYPEGDPQTEAPAGNRYFRKTFELEDIPKSALLVVTADNSAEVFVNGHKVGATRRWNISPSFDVTQFVVSGKNTLAICANNIGGPAGLIARLIIEPKSGEAITFITDSTWKTTDSENPEWTNTDFDDSAWMTAHDIGPSDTSPWKIPDSPTLQKPQSMLFRKVFQVNKQIKHAQTYTCGLGFFELRINGNKVGDDVLQPGFTKYDKRALYITNDVTNMLNSGDNAIGVILGNGWFNSQPIDAWDFDKAPWRKTPRLLFQMNIEYTDGTSDTIVSDGTWKTAQGPIVFDSIRNGETYDARLERQGWDNIGYSENDWKPVITVDGPTTKLIAQKTPPIRVKKIIDPVKITEPKPGVFLFDFGQNLAGWGRLKVTGPAGTKITIKYDERLNEDGSLYQSNAHLVYTGNFQTDTYILKGEGVEVWEPRFVYAGFQYAQIEGFPGKPTKENLQACVVYTDFEENGKFECSNDLLNRIQQCAKWAYISNFVGYPTDCPHREKNGWTGDAQLAAEMGLYNFNPAASYTKWIDDFDDAQAESGDLPGIVPTTGWGYGVGPAWDSAYILIPWYQYLYCGDTRILSSHYDGFKRYVDFLSGKAEGHIVSYGLGDWCPPEGSFDTAKSPASLTSTAYYYVDALLVSKIARMLGREEDAKKYSDLASAIRTAFNAKFYDAATGIYEGNCQTSQCTPLYQGLAPQDEEEKIIAVLLNQIKDYNDHLDCGILGTKYLLHVLSDRNKTDIAYRIVNQRTFPSWGHWIEQGATTLWENWQGTASRNHIMFGDVSAWFYQAIAGINPDPANPGFKHIIIRPGAVGDLKHARAEHISMYGRISSEWSKGDDRFTLNVEIPVNTTATVYIPGSDPEIITEDGRPLKNADSINLLGSRDGCTVVEVGSGSYKFAVAR